MTKIVVPIDFSDNSVHALRYAASVSFSLHTEIHLFHAYSPTTATAVMIDISDVIKKDAERKLQNLAKEANREFPEIKFSFAAREGYLTTHLPGYIEENHIDLIVMGTTGNSGIKNRIFGSNTLKILGKTSTALLIVPPKCEFPNAGQTICITTDLRKINSNRLANLIDGIASFLNLKIKISTVNQAKVGHLDSDTIATLDLTQSEASTEMIFAENVFDELVNLSQYPETCLMVMVSRKKSFLEKLIEGSMTQRLAKIVEKPLLVIKD